MADLGSALSSNRTDQDSVQRLVLDKIQSRLNELDLQLNNNELLLREVLRDELVEDGCTSTVVQEMTTEVLLAGDTGIELTVESLFDPILLSLSVFATVDVSGIARQVFGIRLGRCRELATDSFVFAANGPLDLVLDISITLNPVWLTEDTLRITPEITLDGELRESNIRVDVDDSLIRGLLERFLQSEVDDLFSADNFTSEIASLQATLDEQLSTDLSGNTIDIELPPADDEQIAALYELLTPQARFPLTLGFLRQNRLEIIAALIFDDQDRIAELLEDAAFCELTEQLQIELPAPPVYENINGNCVISENVGNAGYIGDLYGDAACVEPFGFYATSFADYCAVALNSNRLGNAASNSGELQRWSVSPGSYFEIGALPIAGKARPFVQRVNYKNVPNEQGNCSLEMRIYKDNPSSTNQKPLIALHGGSWQNRGSGFIGVENMATHFTDAGFVVFAPFYRLVHDSDGSPACHNATLAELLADVDDAFDWVVQNLDLYGAEGKPTVFGQSAGGHLAAHLATGRPSQVDRTVLFYAPTDFEDFARQIQNGEYVNEVGIRIMQRVTGSTIETLDLQNDLVVKNTYPVLVESQPDNYPPVFMLHGESDTLLPFRQSARMCNGLAGDLASGPAPYILNTGSTRRIISCDNRGSQLHLIAEGEHTLDLCISDDLCFAGSPASADATADSMQQMLDWVGTKDLTTYSTQRRSQGSGALNFTVLFLLVVYFGCGRPLIGARSGNYGSTA